MTIKVPHRLRLNEHDDHRGRIAWLQPPELPFVVHRFYVVHSWPKAVIRGFHSHRNLEQVLMALHGSIAISTIDSLGHRSKFVLEEPADGLYLPPMTWRVIRSLSASAVMAVLASESYDESDYIRDFSEFERESLMGGGRGE